MPENDKSEALAADTIIGILNTFHDDATRRRVLTLAGTQLGITQAGLTGQVTEHVFINGIVAARNHKPYVQIASEHGLFAQLGVSTCRKVAADITQAIARVEADALLARFFTEQQFPNELVGSLMVHFREFRAELDAEDE